MMIPIIFIFIRKANGLPALEDKPGSGEGAPVATPAAVTGEKPQVTVGPMCNPAIELAQLLFLGGLRNSVFQPTGDYMGTGDHFMLFLQYFIGDIVGIL